MHELCWIYHDHRECHSLYFERHWTYLFTLIGNDSPPSLGLMLTSYLDKSIFCGSAHAIERDVSVRDSSSIEATPVGTEVTTHYSHILQNRMLVGCVPPACQPYVFWWSPLDVSSSGV